jgi:hypothetical protein
MTSRPFAGVAIEVNRRYLFTPMNVWRALLIVYRELDVHLPARRGRKRRFHHVAGDEEITDAIESFRAFPQLAADLTSGAAQVEPRIVQSAFPLRSLSENGEGCYWPSPDDTRRELDEFAPAGGYDSLFVFWPQNDFAARSTIPCRGWGLGMGASDWSHGATYAVVANAPTQAWHREARGEVWLHEWLHGVCHHFASQGHVMPARDADGAEVHDYARSPLEGWTEYYRDLMSGNVEEKGARLGIPLTAWGKDSSRTG